MLSRVKDAKQHQLFLAKQRILARKRKQEASLEKEEEEEKGLEELKDISNAEGTSSLLGEIRWFSKSFCKS